MSSKSATSNTSEATPQQIGKAFVVQYYRLLHEHPESLHRFYSTSSTLMHDDPNKTVTGIENIAKRIEDLSLKQRHVKIRQVDCHSTVGSSVVVQVCGEISSTPVIDNNQTPIMKRFVQTFVLAPTTTSDKQKYYVHNDIFRYQENQTAGSTADNDNARPSSLNTSNEASASTPTKTIPVQTPITPSSIINIEFSNDLEVEPKKDEKTNLNANATAAAAAPSDKQKGQEKQQSSKPKSYRDAIAKKEKVPTNENSTAAASATATTSTPVQNAGAAAPTPTTPSTATSTKSGKSKQKSKSANKNKGQARGHPQDTDEYYDDSWYYGGEDVEAYLTTGYVDDQEVFVGDLSAQITEEQIREMFRPFGRLLLVRIGNTGSQVGAANFAFCVCQSVDMAKAVVADRDSFFQKYKVNVEAKKRRPFPHTFRPTYPTAASPNNYQSTGYPAAFYQHSAAAAATAPFYDGGVSGRAGGAGGAAAPAAASGKRGGKGGAHPKN